jgi:predicted anti-sigma-YlaC factor YlaD
VNCRDWGIEIVESARLGANPPASLKAHLGECADCRELWGAEQAVQLSLVKLRAAVASQRSPDRRRVELLREFGRVHRASESRRVHWAFAAAAAVLFVFALGLSGPAASVSSNASQDRIAMLLSDDRMDSAEFDPVSDDSGFVAVPYAAPLASGEFVKVVRTKLYAAALDRMGVSVPVGNGEFPADVMLGEDGLPRAVRVLDAQF